MIDRTIILIISLLLLGMPIAYSATVLGTESRPSYINITMLNQEPDPVEPGEVVELRFNVQNFGSDNAEEFQMEIMPEFPFSMYVGTAVKSLGTIFGRQMGVTRSATVYYKIKVGEDAVDGDNDLYIRFKYKKGIQEIAWTKYYNPFKVRIRPREPILFIDSVETLPEQIAPGEKGIVNVKLKSIVNSLVKNVKATLQIDSLPFVPLGSSNEKVIKQIQPKGEAVLSFDLTPEASAEAKYYKIPLKLEYYVNGKEYNKTNYIGIEVNEIPDVYAIIDSTAIYQRKQPGKITIKFVNKGSSDIKFLNSVLKQSDDYDIISSDKVYIGNIDSDDYETADYEVYIKSKKRDVDLLLQYTFLDANNKEYAKDIKLKLKIYSTSEAKKFGLIKSSSGTGIFIIIIIIIAGGYFYIKKIKKVKIRDYFKLNK